MLPGLSVVGDSLDFVSIILQSRGFIPADPPPVLKILIWGSDCTRRAVNLFARSTSFESSISFIRFFPYLLGPVH